MSTRKGTLLASLAVVVAALSPASAPADIGGTDRPVKGSGSGLVSINTQALTLTADATGAISHLGENVTAHVDAHLVGQTPDGVILQGTQTVVADNGDQLTGTVTITGPGPTLSVHPTTAVMTVAGGTGRFADASGTITIDSIATPFSFDGVTLLERIDFTVTGDLSY